MDLLTEIKQLRGPLKIPTVTLDGSGNPVGFTFRGENIPLGGIALADVWTAGGVRWDGTDLIDENAAVISGTLTVTNYSDLPTASTKNGKTYIVTAPTPAAYYSNGTSWYQIGGVEPMYTWANFPEANTVPLGTTFRIDPSSFGGTYKNPLGILMVSDGTNWRPKNGRQTMARMASTLASPASSCTTLGTSDILFDIATNFSMPARLLAYTGIGVSVKAVFAKTGADATASTFRVKMGKNNNASTSDIVFSGVTSAIALRDFKVDQEARVTATGAAATAQFTTDTLQGNGQGTSLVFDRNQYLDTTLVNYILFTADGTNTATHGLVSLSIELLA